MLQLICSKNLHLVECWCKILSFCHITKNSIRFSKFGRLMYSVVIWPSTDLKDCWNYAFLLIYHFCVYKSFFIYRVNICAFRLNFWSRRSMICNQNLKRIVDITSIQFENMKCSWSGLRLWLIEFNQLYGPGATTSISTEYVRNPNGMTTKPSGFYPS